MEVIERGAYEHGASNYFCVHVLAELVRKLDEIPHAVARVKESVCNEDYGMYFQLWVTVCLKEHFKVVEIEKSVEDGSSIDAVIEIDGQLVNCHIGQIDQSKKMETIFDVSCTMSSRAFSEHREIGIKDIDGVLSKSKTSELITRVFEDYPTLSCERSYTFENPRSDNPDIVTITFAPSEECSTGKLTGIDHFWSLAGKLKGTKEKIILKLPKEIHVFIGVTGFIESVGPVELEAYQLDGIFFFSKPTTPDFTMFQSERTRLQVKPDSPHKSVLELMDAALPMKSDLIF